MPDLQDLGSRHCTPLKGAAHRLEAEQVRQSLSVLPGWEAVNEADALRKVFRFPDYYHTIAFVNALAWMAHREDHHPDLEVGYNRCVVNYSTHDVGGVSENDLICAARAERLAADAPA